MIMMKSMIIISRINNGRGLDSPHSEVNKPNKIYDNGRENISETGSIA